MSAAARACQPSLSLGSLLNSSRPARRACLTTSLRTRHHLKTVAASGPGAMPPSGSAADGASAPAAAAASPRAGRLSSEGARAATQLVDAAEERVEQLERVLSSEAEAHLGPASAAGGEEANVHYFAFGSNINRKVFEGRRRIQAAESFPAVLPGWKLTFSQPGLPFSEPAFAAVEPAAEVAATPSTSSGSSGSGELPDVHGVVHRITPSQWAYVLETEGASGQDSDHAYRVVEVEAVGYDGRKVQVVTLTVSPAVKGRLKGRPAQPSLRYLTLIREGAADYGLQPGYRAFLDTLQPYRAHTPGQRAGALLFGAVAALAIFPVWAGARFVRKFTGMERANKDALASFVGRYTSLCFAAILGLHEVLRPVLGCGMTSPALPAAAKQD